MCLSLKPYAAGFLTEAMVVAYAAGFLTEEMVVDLKGGGFSAFSSYG
jgi:hypothetical protein